MKFQRESSYHERSDCRRFTVAAVKVQGEFRFIAWRIVGGNDEVGEMLGIYQHASAARARCEAEVSTLRVA